MQDARATRLQPVVRGAVCGAALRRGGGHGERERRVEVLAQRTEVEPPGGGPLPAPRAAELHALLRCCTCPDQPRLQHGVGQATQHATSASPAVATTATATAAAAAAAAVRLGRFHGRPARARRAAHLQIIQLKLKLGGVGVAVERHGRAAREQV